MASLLKVGDLRGGKPLLLATIFPADEHLVIDNPREFVGGIPICTNVTVMSCLAGVMCGSFDAGEVNQVEHTGGGVLNDSTKNGFIIGGGGIGFEGYLLLVGTEPSVNPTLVADSWRHSNVHLD